MNERAKYACPVCGGHKISKFWASAGYRLARCLDCTMVWDYMPYENILAQYDKTYFINDNPKGGYANYYEGMAINKKTFEDRLKKIEKKMGKGRLLDVGCALGDCLLVAKKLGWENPQGLEVSEYAYKIARKRGLKVKKGTLNRDTFEENSFDTVTYQDVIEHIPNSVTELKKAYRVLKPGGLLYIITPDIGEIWAKLLGSLWYHYKPVEHVNYFSQQSIRRALESSGFEKIETARTYHVLSVEYILSRLRYYSPKIFGFLLNLIKKTPFRNMSFKAYTGELEAWGLKPN